MRKLITIAAILCYFTAPSKSPGSCQSQYNASYSSCTDQYQMDMKVVSAFTPIRGAQSSFGTNLKAQADKRLSDCIGRAERNRNNCMSK